MLTTSGIGNLCANPQTFEYENKRTGKMENKVSLRVAINDGKDHTTFLNVICFGQSATYAGTYLKKGNKIGFTGQLQVREYDRKDGGKGIAVEVVAGRIEGLTPKAAQSDDLD